MALAGKKDKENVCTSKLVIVQFDFLSLSFSLSSFLGLCSVLTEMLGKELSIVNGDWEFGMLQSPNTHIHKLAVYTYLSHIICMHECDNVFKTHSKRIKIAKVRIENASGVRSESEST